MPKFELKGQIELGISRNQERDHNFHLGGRSFYFFDFDDNIAFLMTPLVLFHKETKQELMVSSGEYAQQHQFFGKSGVYKDYFVDYNDSTGTFRNFRDHSVDELLKFGKKSQIFVEDIAEVLGHPNFHWKGPSWETFYHATFNQRPVSVITARGHHPETFKQGIELMVNKSVLPMRPNYLSIYPVSHITTRKELGDDELVLTVAELKQRAIRASFLAALNTYGYSSHHRFGMSDDDPKNIQLIGEELTRLKNEYPEISFFMIETHNGNFIKHEIKQNGWQSDKLLSEAQLKLFNQD